MKKIPMTIRLSGERHEQVTQESIKTGVSINGLVNQAFELYFRYKEAEDEFRNVWLNQILETRVSAPYNTTYVTNDRGELEIKDDTK
jgi:hypothetical protein